MAPPDRQVEVVPWRSHRGGDQHVVESDLERFLDRQLGGCTPARSLANVEPSGELRRRPAPCHLQQATGGRTPGRSGPITTCPWFDGADCTAMSVLSTRLVQRLRDRSSQSVSADPLYQGVVGYTDDTKGWNPTARALTSPIDAAAAHDLHLGTRGWSCVLRSSGRLVVVAHHPAGEIRVMRYDATDAFVVETRQFHPVDDRLWLRSIKRVNGDEARTQPHLLVTDWFTWVRPHTTATWTRFDHRSPQGRQHEIRLEWDPTGNWFTHPERDAYDTLVEPTDLLARLWPESTELPVIAS